MNRKTNLSRAVVAFFAFCLCWAARSAADEVKRVFIVHSYEEGHICGQPQQEGVVEALKAAGYTPGKDLSLAAYYMDTKKNYVTRGQIDERGRLALEAVKAFMPHVVVVLDDNAVRTVMLPLAGSDFQVVFCGMNGQPETYNKAKRFMENREKPGGNITGVYEKLHFVTSVKVIKAVIPEARKILALTDTSPTGKAITVQLEKELAEQTPEVPCEIVTVKDFAEFQKIILDRVNKDPEIGAIASMVLKVDGLDGEVYTAAEIFRWQIAHCTKPSMALNYFFSKLGLFGGAAVDFKAMGRQAGAQAAKILAGASAGDLPIEDARKYAIIFNTARARDLGISIPFEILGAADFVYDTIGLQEGPKPADSCDGDVREDASASKKEAP